MVAATVSRDFEFLALFKDRWFFATGLVGLLTLVVTMMVTSLSVAREREQGTFDQLLVTPRRPFEILIGKAMPGVVIGVLEASVVTALAVYWFGVSLQRKKRCLSSIAVPDYADYVMRCPRGRFNVQCEIVVYINRDRSLCKSSLISQFMFCSL